MKRAEEKNRLGSVLTLLLLFCVLAGTVTAQPYTDGEPPRKTSVQDIIDNQQDIEEQLKSMSRAMTEMKDSMEGQINSMRQSTILFLFALFFFYKASSALWNRILKYRRWQKHASIKTELESATIKLLKEQKELLAENNSKLAAAFKRLNELSPSTSDLGKVAAAEVEGLPHAEVKTPSTAAGQEPSTPSLAKVESPAKKTDTKHAKKRPRGIFYALFLILFLAGSTYGIYVFSGESVLAGAFAVIVVFALFWLFVILTFIRYRRRKTSKKSKVESAGDVQDSREDGTKKEEKPTDSESKKEQPEVKVYTPKKTPEVQAPTKTKEPEKKPEKEPEPEEKPLKPKKKSFWSRLKSDKPAPIKKDKPTKLEAEVPEINEAETMMAEIAAEGEVEEDYSISLQRPSDTPEPHEEIKKEVLDTPDAKRVESYLETTILDILNSKEKKTTNLTALNRKLDASLDEIRDCIKNSKLLDTKSSRVFLKEAK